MGNWRTLLTSTAWNNLGYYGKKLKADFQILDRYIKIALENGELQDVNVDNLLKMMRQKTHITFTIKHLVESLDTIEKREHIEKIIDAISPEALLEAKLKVEK